MRWTPEEFSEAIGGFRRMVAGMLRRMRLGVTDGGIWQAIGHALLNSAERETAEIEAWQGIGIYSKPPAGGSSAEAIVAQLGGDGANAPAIIATRDEETRAAAFATSDIAPDETALFNSEVRLYLKADGTIEARTHAGVAVALAKNADLKAIVDILCNWIVVPMDGGAALQTAVQLVRTVDPGFPHGTQKLKGQ